MSHARAVVLSPHLDDAILSAWSVLRRDHEVRVVNVCTGIPPAGVLSRWDRLTGAVSSRARMVERLDEDREALALAGHEPIGLDFPEVQYRCGPLDPETLAGALSVAVDATAELWAPAGIGGHDDHLQVRDVAIRLARERGVALRLYADVPYAIRYGWPGWVTGTADHPHLRVEHWWDRFLPSDLELEAERHELSDGELELKLSAIGTYRTQVTALNGGPFGLLEHRAVMRHEVSWAVRTA